MVHYSFQNIEFLKLMFLQNILEITSSELHSVRQEKSVNRITLAIVVFEYIVSKYLIF